MKESDSELSGAIIGAAIRVHEELGPGFLESVYEQALAVELRSLGISFERQVLVPITYRSQSVGEHRLDLLVDREVVVELKTVNGFDPVHFAVVRSYLKATNCSLGLLLNFAGTKLEVRRVGREWHSRVP